ncbi:VCBS repeat-containing protein, partial [Mesorhizobium soli]|uniref:calcium-binding protein n=1 Tax=Pseudaminobacter soli (ex Li et al. 2025) TaxID=1295366 RepID=UPI002474D0AF
PVVVKDADGDPAPAGNLVINIVDDVPTAHADELTIGKGDFAGHNGNVITGAGEDNPAAGADVKGADGASVTSAYGTGSAQLVTDAGTTIAGQYGTLVLKADGSYTYTRNPGTKGGVDDVFHYTLTDGDGDTSSTTLTIHIGDAGVTVGSPGTGAGVDTVYEAGLANGSHVGPTQTVASGVITVAAPDGVGSITVNGVPVVLNGTHTTIADGARGSLDVWWNGTSIQYQYTLQHNYLESPAVNNGRDLEATPQFAVKVTDQDGSVGNGTLTINIYDDAPILNSVQNQQASNDPSQTPAVGHIDFVPGADGVGSAMTISANTTGITSGGHNLITVQEGNVLTAYADNDNSGTYNQGDTAVFTITVDPTGGQYVFDLKVPLDGVTTPVSIGSGSSFGSGPSSSVVVSQGGQNIVMVTGWKSTDSGGVFTSQHEKDWLQGGNPALTQTNDVNGSGQGWGLGNNNFDKGEFMRFDFGTPNDYDGAGPYTPPNITLANVSFATFKFETVSSANKIEFVAHYTDGTFAAYVPANGATSVTITSPAGAQIAWIDAYESSGKTKLNLTSVGVTSTTVDHTIPVTLQLTDGDGDHTGTASFNIHVADGLTPSAVATPAGLDANHNAIQALDVSHLAVAFDYNGEGIASKTAADVGPNHGILAIDPNGNSIGSSGSEITQHDVGAATDLTAPDGKPTALEIETFASPALGEHISGSDNNDLLVGDSANHILDGGPGNDILIGGAGNDLLIGGLGQDTLTGASGADTFKLDSLDIKDLITDYNGGEGDVIDLTALFKTDGGNLDDFVRYDQSTGTLSVDKDGAANGTNFVDVATLQNTPVASTITLLYDDDKHATAPGVV